MRGLKYIVSFETREVFLCLFVWHGRIDDDIFSWFPVGGGDDLVFIGSLQRLCDAVVRERFRWGESRTYNRIPWGDVRVTFNC